MKTIKCPICHKQAEQSSHWDDVYNCGVDEKYFGLPHYTMDLKDEVYSIVIDGCSVSCLIKENITIIDNAVTKEYKIVSGIIHFDDNILVSFKETIQNFLLLR